MDVTLELEYCSIYCLCIVMLTKCAEVRCVLFAMSFSDLLSVE